jgi:hypothetical protein
MKLKTRKKENNFVVEWEGKLTQKPLVLHQRFFAPPSHRTFQQLLDVPLQVVVGRYPDGVLHPPPPTLRKSPAWQRLVGPKRDFFVHLLLSLNFR